MSTPYITPKWVINGAKKIKDEIDKQITDHLDKGLPLKVFHITPSADIESLGEVDKKED